MKIWTKHNALALLALVILIWLLGGNSSEQVAQTVAPACFSQQDCWEPLQPGYCSVKYDCIAGQCHSKQIVCPEVCGSGTDEDKDGLLDCQDPDCFNSPNCPCEAASFNGCTVGRCYCPTATVPRWTVLGGEHWCQCMSG